MTIRVFQKQFLPEDPPDHFWVLPNIIMFLHWEAPILHHHHRDDLSLWQHLIHSLSILGFLQSLDTVLISPWMITMNDWKENFMSIVELIVTILQPHHQQNRKRDKLKLVFTVPYCLQRRRRKVAMVFRIKKYHELSFVARNVNIFCVKNTSKFFTAKNRYQGCIADPATPIPLES